MQPTVNVFIETKRSRLSAKLERAEINPKKRMSTNTYDSSADVFKLDLVYKDKNGVEHDLKWLVKVTRSAGKKLVHHS